MRTLALTAAVAAVLLTGCSGGGNSMDAIHSESAPQAAASAMAPGPVGEEKSDRAEVQVTKVERQVVYVAALTVRADDVAAAAERAKTVVAGAGGHLAKEESDSSDHSGASANLVFKVPPARYQEVLRTLGRDLGRRLTLTQGTEDVTLKVADVESRLKSAEKALASLRELLGKAGSINHLLEVEREIADREADLESLQAQQKELAARTSMATVTLNLVAPTTEAPPDPDDEPAGFLGGLSKGWRALTAFLSEAVTVLGVLLPWLLVAAPVVLLLVWLARRVRPPGPSPVSPSPTSSMSQSSQTPTPSPSSTSETSPSPSPSPSSSEAGEGL
jgi:hypothetical protein